MFKINKIIFIIYIIIIIITSCAKSTEPVSSEDILKIDMFYSTIGYARDIFVSDSLLYIAEDQGGFSIYNHATNTQYCRFTEFENARLISAVEEDSILFVYDRYGEFAGLRVFDISDLTVPQEDMLVTGRNIEAIKTYKNDNGTIEILATFENEYGYGEYNGTYWYTFFYRYFPNYLVGFDIDSCYIYIAGEQLGLYIVDRTATALNILSITDTPGEALDVKLVNNYVFIADKQEGFSIIDISNKENPEIIFQQDTSGWAQSIDVEGNYLVIGSGGGGVYLYDISDIQNPTFIDRIDDSIIGYTYRVKIWNCKIFAATKKGVYKLSFEIE